MAEPITGRTVRVGVLGAGPWASSAHLPGWKRDPRCELVAVCDRERGVAEKAAATFDIPSISTDYRAVVERSDVDVIDVVTPNLFHREQALAALEAGKHVLCEKPVAFDFRQTLEAAALARAKGLKTKLGFTFRYAPAMLYMKELVDQGFCGQPFIYNAFEQNSQWLNPQTPLRQVRPTDDESQIRVASLEGYGAPVIDIARWMVGAELTAVVGTMRNFVPERILRATGQMTRLNIDDGDIFLGEFANGAIGSIQSSYVTVGNFPGSEVRLFGSEGAIATRLVEEFGINQTIKAAKPDDVEFKDLEIPARFFPAGGSSRESWRSLFYANLIRDFLDELTTETPKNQGNFDDAAHVQEIINAVERSFRERRWVDLPLPR